MPDARTETVLWSSNAGEASLRHFRLELLDGTTAARTFDVGSGVARCSIGSHASNDVVIDDPTVSRFHCEIHVDGSRAFVRDLESRNGTVVDGVLTRDAFLRAGSIINVGRASLRFQPRDQSSPILVSEKKALGDLVGHSLAMRSCFAILERAAETDVTILLEGETGTGKSRAARAVHMLSSRAKRPFLTLDCAALPPNLLESELFGHKKGAFTGAIDDRAGIFEDANGGTVFLDEIGEIPLELQPKLLKALEDREIRRVGTTGYKPIDVRVIAATNRDLRMEVNAGRFRADLYYRLAVVRVLIPSLRQRPEDIRPIAEQLLDRLAAPAEVRAALKTPEFMARLTQAAWPGNVRELRNHLERCLVFRDALPPTESGDAGGATMVVSADEPYAEARRKALEVFERSYVKALLELHGGNVTRAAEAADVDRAYLYKLLRRHREGT
jgi:two-component system, NtrC family, response regulator GlrR